VELADGEKIPCEAVFSSIPIDELVHAFSDPPQEVSSVARNLPFRDLMTVNLLVDGLAIKNTTSFKTLGRFIPDVWIYVQERQVRMGRLEIYNNFSPYLVKDPVGTVWLAVEYFCNEGDTFWTMTDTAFIDYCVKELRTIGLLDEKSVVLDRLCTRTKKAYPAYFGSYARFGTVRAWLDRFENLYCIGRNGQHRYNNMDHSMLCGFEAARALVNGTDKAALWNVNTEETYHEEKR
jgi:protoporphyrinogen oxidase